MDELKQFAETLNGRQYEYPQFTKEEIQLAKDNGYVIVTGASDDLIELEGSICYETGCYGGEKIYIDTMNFHVSKEEYDIFHNLCIKINWCKDKDKNDNIIPWTYETAIKHENFIVYKDDKPYCRGIVFELLHLGKQ